jgi:hypothetical protein
MFTITWNPHGFHIVDKLPNDAKMDSDYFMTKIISMFEQAIFPRGRAAHQKRVMVHIDSCSVRTSPTSTSWLEEHGMGRMPYPSYSPDLTPNDFYLFLTVKEKLERIQVTEEDQHFECLQEILGVSITTN